MAAAIRTMFTSDVEAMRGLSRPTEPNGSAPRPQAQARGGADPLNEVAVREVADRFAAPGPLRDLRRAASDDEIAARYARLPLEQAFSSAAAPSLMYSMDELLVRERWMVGLLREQPGASDNRGAPARRGGSSATGEARAPGVTR